MTLIFKHGALSANAVSWTQQALDKYPYGILLKEYLDYDWIQANLILHDCPGEDCMGNDYIKKSHVYTCFEHLAGKIYFFYDKRDYEKVLTLTDNVIDPNPFTTQIENGTVDDKWWNDLLPHEKSRLHSFYEDHMS